MSTAGCGHLHTYEIRCGCGPSQTKMRCGVDRSQRNKKCNFSSTEFRRNSVDQMRFIQEGALSLQLLVREFCEWQYLRPHITMCDFHDFGFTWKCKKMCFGWLHDYLKRLISTFFEIFSHSAGTFEIFSKNVDFSLWGKHNIVRENETKIVKIAHSVLDNWWEWTTR